MVSDPKPPTPQFSGSSTPWATAVVTAASTALPPCSRTDAPISTALACGATIIPGIDSLLPYRLSSQASRTSLSPVDAISQGVLWVYHEGSTSNVMRSAAAVV